MEVFYLLLATACFVLAVYFAYLGLRLPFISHENYSEYRKGLGGFKGVLWGDNEIKDEARCEGLVINREGGLKLKTSHGKAAIERLLR